MTVATFPTTYNRESAPQRFLCDVVVAERISRPLMPGAATAASTCGHCGQGVHASPEMQRLLACDGIEMLCVECAIARSRRYPVRRTSPNART